MTLHLLGILFFYSSLAVTTSPDACANTDWPSGLPRSPPAVNNVGFATRHGKLSLNGRQLVDAQGNPVQLMGMSSHGLQWFSQCTTLASIQYLAANWGVNVFRAALYIAATENGYEADIGLLTHVKNIVAWCKQVGIYVIIDYHILTPGNTAYYLGISNHANAVTFWQEMANLYHDQHHVLYEIANEPNNVAWSSVKSYAETVITAIRAIDAQTIIIVGTATWSQDVDQAAANQVAATLRYNVMYAFHFYAGTHIGLLQRLVGASQVIPIFCTEWGTSEASGDNGPFLANAMVFLKKFINQDGDMGQTISWTQWSYADKSEVSAALSPGACGSFDWDKTSCSGQFVRSFIQANVQTDGGTTPTTAAPPTASPTTTTTPPTTSPTTTSTPPTTTTTSALSSSTANPASCTVTLKLWDGCLSTPSCCPSGASCYQQTQWYAQCLLVGTCPTSGWTCTVLGQGTGGQVTTTTSAPQVTTATLAPQVTTTTLAPQVTTTTSKSSSCSVWQNCLATFNCCPTGTNCYKQHQWYAQCRSSCPPDWSCEILGFGGGGSGAGRRLLQAIPRGPGSL
eukprot:gb/GEZN01004744.1/.p1 GENE.gb/GEZN01004744.1/~~gb/GEZN01004744.1/.p1  ORF type:complete len:568 (-),score=66.14 gb/GEZN01004744.1/:126-1829(-)